MRQILTGNINIRIKTDSTGRDRVGLLDGDGRWFDFEHWARSAIYRSGTTETYTVKPV